MRVFSSFAVILVASLSALLVEMTMIPVSAMQSQAFLGRWNITGTGEDANRVYWLELKETSGQLTGMFLNRGGSPVPLEIVKVEKGELIFRPTVARGGPGPEFHARVEGDKLVGTVPQGDRTVTWVGVRPPKWPAANANAKHSYGKPVELFDGKSMDAFKGQDPNRPLNWGVEDGVMTNTPPANNLVSKATFKDFRLQAEYKLTEGSNSGIYLRGRYELQVLDDYGKPPESHGHMAIYAWTAPLVNASKPVGEWQVMEAVIVANRVTVTLNGKKVHDNAEIQAITGGALDANETDPGPIMIQGDHNKVWFRKLTVTPIS
jgi:hypothetical protein